MAWGVAGEDPAGHLRRRFGSLNVAHRETSEVPFPAIYMSVCGQCVYLLGFLLVFGWLCFKFFEPYLEMLRPYSWFWAQGSLLRALKNLFSVGDQTRPTGNKTSTLPLELSLALS